MILKTVAKKVFKADDIKKIFHNILNAEHKTDQDKEHLWVVGLNTKSQIQYIDLATLGILDQTLVTPREVFRLAIMKGVSRIIVVHNHPSGCVTPSPNDRKTMKTLSTAGKILNVELLDFVIIGNIFTKGYWSAADEGKI